MRYAWTLLLSAILFAGCSKQADQLAQGWSAPIKVTDSKDSLVDGVDLYKWHSTIIALQGLDDRSAKCFLMNQDSNHWSEVPFSGVPHGDYLWAYPTMDQSGGKVFFQQGYIENNQLKMGMLLGSMTEMGGITVRDTTERKWITDVKSLFGETPSNVRLTERNEPGKHAWPQLGLGIINGTDLYIPFYLDGFTYNEKGVAIAREPNYDGVFHSTDSGMTWRPERISASYGALPSMSRTKDYYYYFAVSYPPKPGEGFRLWFSRKSVGGNSWDAPKVITKTFCDSGLSWKYVAEPQDDTVHLCWLDRRHEKRRVNFMGEAKRENYEVAYSQRKDSDSNWSKDVILSEGIFYSYSPTMSVEGDKIVAAWAGVQTAPDWHTDYEPNDIYYRTSKDGGKTWDKLLKVTDGVKDGLTAGRPQVALQNGIIHLFYIQGKMNLKQESPGLTKLNQPPWPIYYQQRPFPN